MEYQTNNKLNEFLTIIEELVKFCNKVDGEYGVEKEEVQLGKPNNTLYVASGMKLGS